MSLTDQLNALLEAGVAEAAAVTVDELRGYAAALPDEPGAVIAVHPRLAPARVLAPLLRHRENAGFVVTDLTDLAEFEPISGVAIPDAPLYLVHDVDRGDDMRNWSPDESLPAITERGRTPLTISEGISWLLQEPKHLEANHCFMTIASRKRARRGLDARTPAIWISGGTGRDGPANRGAPKVGWCWAGNRHTWLGMASASRRSPLGGAQPRACTDSTV
jgi:Family of unknown function (DUF5701)